MIYQGANLAFGIKQFYFWDRVAGRAIHKQKHGWGPARAGVPGFMQLATCSPCPCQGFDSTPQRKDLFVVEEYMTKQLDRKVATRLTRLDRNPESVFALYCNVISVSVSR